MLRTLFVLIVFAIYSGCSSENTTPVSKNNQTNTAEKTRLTEASDTKVERQDLIYARVGKEDISQADIDKLIALQLFDLEWVKYDLRRKTLSRVVGEKTKEGSTRANLVEVFIEPPMPPRLSLEISDKQPSFGNQRAPITMAVFCSYPSVHCAGMTKTYDALLSAYPEQIRLVFFDFPQAFHFNAGHAARAARCANQGGKFWTYHKGLLANYDQVSEKLFMRLARQVNLDMPGFKSCFDNNGYANEVKENLKQAEHLGLSKVPVTLINGLFINGPRSFDTMRYFIDKELERLNITPKYKLQQAKQVSLNQEIPISALPLRLEAITLAANSEHSTATIQHLTDSASYLYKQDDEVLPKVYLLMIQKNAVILEHSGKLERVMLSAGQVNATEQAANTDSNESLSVASRSSTELVEPYRRPRGKSLADPDEIPAGLEYEFRGVVSAKGETPLSRSWLTEQLVDRDRLKDHFEPAELEVEGVYVMRLTNIKENDFYQTLGLQERDVVLRVNNEWVHTAQNNLFDTLENQEDVSVVLMRKGLPVHLNYHIN